MDRHNWTSRVFAPAAQRAGVRCTPGDGRHTFASLLLNGGEPLISVSNQLGHTMAQTTQRYSHLVDRSRRGLPMEAAILAARAEFERDRVPNVCQIDEYRARRATG